MPKKVEYNGVRKHKRCNEKVKDYSWWVEPALAEFLEKRNCTFSAGRKEEETSLCWIFGEEGAAVSAGRKEEEIRIRAAGAGKI